MVQSRAGECLYAISALIGKEVFAKIVQFDRYAVEKWGPGAPPGRIFVATPSITSENAFVGDCSHIMSADFWHF